MKTLKNIVREVESNLVDLLDRKELGRYALNKDFDKIYKKIDEMVSEFEVVIKSMAGRL